MYHQPVCCLTDNCSKRPFLPAFLFFLSFFFPSWFIPTDQSDWSSIYHIEPDWLLQDSGAIKGRYACIGSLLFPTCSLSINQAIIGIHCFRGNLTYEADWKLGTKAPWLSLRCLSCRLPCRFPKSELEIPKPLRDPICLSIRNPNRPIRHFLNIEQSPSQKSPRVLNITRVFQFLQTRAGRTRTALNFVGSANRSSIHPYPFHQLKKAFEWIFDKKIEERQ